MVRSRVKGKVQSCGLVCHRDILICNELSERLLIHSLIHKTTILRWGYRRGMDWWWRRRKRGVVLLLGNDRFPRSSRSRQGRRSQLHHCIGSLMSSWREVVAALLSALVNCGIINNSIVSYLH